MEFDAMDGNGNLAPDIGTRILSLVGRRRPQPSMYPSSQALPDFMLGDHSLGSSPGFAPQQQPPRTLQTTRDATGLASGSYRAAPIYGSGNVSARSGHMTGEQAQSSSIMPYGEAKPSPVQPGAKKSHPKTPTNLATDEDQKSGNYIEVGFRHTHDWKTGHLANHSYIGVPELKEGKWVMTYYEVLGDKNSTKNQEVRNTTDDDRHIEANDKGKYLLSVNPAQKEALLSRLKYFADDTGSNYSHPCPSCGSRYHAIFPEPWNSNTFVYNMLIHNPAGRIEPPEPPHALFGTPGYKVNAPGERWYQ